jgi:radical SAM superfamily enzyme YgiQ (UPF0313 family)
LKKTRSYLHESGSIRKPLAGKLRIALAFPNTYYVGMSNLGFQLIYRKLNSFADVVCERVFLPADSFVTHQEDSRRPPVSVESRQPLNSFHIIAFSVSFETDYLNILSMLKSARLALLRSERSAAAPLIIGGGVAFFLNPEPLADIFDLFMIGEAEEMIEEFLDVLRQERTGTRWIKPDLKAFAHIAGMYVPAGYCVSYRPDGTIKSFRPAPGFPDTVARRWVADLNKFSGRSCLSTPDTEFADMALVEVSRGCPRRCRFCAAGHVYRPYRIRTMETLEREIIPGTRSPNKIGLLGAAVGDHPDISRLVHLIAAHGAAAAVSSLRVDTLSEELVARLRESRHLSFTIAPETGSERLRRVIAKDLTNAEIFAAVALLARHKITRLKLYFLIGLPSERDEDIEAIIDLTRRIRHAYYKEVRGEKWLKQITVSVSLFIPKPATPFQWHPFAEMRELKRKLKIISVGLKKEPKIILTHEIPKWAYVQALLCRGDRRTSAFLMKALELGGNWIKAMREVPLNPDFYVYRHRSREEFLPWDFIGNGAYKDSLWHEYQRALQED